jgi:hypothetical protein
MMQVRFLEVEVPVLGQYLQVLQRLDLNFGVLEQVAKEAIVVAMDQ